MITFPGNGIWATAQNGDRFGNIIRSKNISLDKDGVISLAKKSMVIYSKDDDSGFGNPLAVETDGSLAYMITSDGHFFRMVLTNTSLLLDEAPALNQPELNDGSDMVIYNNTIHATGGNDLNYLNALGQGQTWRSPKPITDLDDEVPHPLCVSPKRNTLLVGDGNIVRQYDTTYTRDTDNELVLPVEFIVTSIRYRIGKVYIGTRHRYGGEAMLFEWNLSGAEATGYPCGADWIYSQCVYLSSIAIINSKGQIKRFNGGGFDVIASLPVYFTDSFWDSNADDFSLVGKVASRGMRANGEILYINIDGSVNDSNLVYPGTYLPEQPSGLWCYDPSVGLYHKAGYNNSTKLSLAVQEIASSNIVFATVHQAQTGDPVLYIGSQIPELSSSQVYYAIRVTATSMMLSLSPEDAVEGTSIQLSGTPTTDRFVFDRYESVSQTVIDSPGGLMIFGRNFPNRFYGSEVLFGGSTIDSTNTAKGMIMSLGMGRNVGSFVLPKVMSQNVKDSFNKIVNFFEGLYLDTDSLVIKFRNMRRLGMPTGLAYSGSATWTSSTTFTVNTGTRDFKGVREGDEVEVVRGAGAGYSAHITYIDTSLAPTYTVTVDEIMPVSSGSFDFIADNWIKLTTVNSDSKEANAALDESTFDSVAAKWIEVKVEMRGKGGGVMIEQTQLVNSTHTKSQ